MGLRALGALAVATAALAFPATAAEVPTEGVFTPGKSLGGVRLGMTKAEVLSTWGKKHGVCRDCPRPTWYFNLKPFEPQGAGVVFREGRVVQAFTVWRPRGWRTPDGLELGIESSKALAAYPGLVTEGCFRYTSYVLPGPALRSVFYSFRGRLWGFGLVRPGLPVCL